MFFDVSFRKIGLIPAAAAGHWTLGSGLGALDLLFRQPRFSVDQIRIQSLRHAAVWFSPVIMLLGEGHQERSPKTIALKRGVTRDANFDFTLRDV